MQGHKVGSCAHVRSLRREQSGEFRVADAWQILDLEDQAWEKGLPRHKRRKEVQDDIVLPAGAI